MKVRTWILRAIPGWESVELERGGEDSTDLFLSQLSMLTSWENLLLQECFTKLDGVNVGAHELLTPSELEG